MASLLQNLIEILDEEVELYNALFKIATKKTKIIVNNDVPSLQAITKNEQELAGRIFRLEKDREGVVKDIAMVLNQNKEELTIEKIISLLNNAEQEQQKLKELQKQIFDVVTNLQEKNQHNKELIQHSLEFIDFTMNAIQSTRTMPATQGYAGHGKITEQTSVRFFDTKQ